MMEAESIFETLVRFYETICRNIPGDSHVHNLHSQNMSVSVVGTQGDLCTAICLMPTVILYVWQTTETYLKQNPIKCEAVSLVIYRVSVKFLMLHKK
jgi:hypothetical protein